MELMIGTDVVSSESYDSGSDFQQPGTKTSCIKFEGNESPISPSVESQISYPSYGSLSGSLHVNFNNAPGTTRSSVLPLAYRTDTLQADQENNAFQPSSQFWGSFGSEVPQTLVHSLAPSSYSSESTSLSSPTEWRTRTSRDDPQSVQGNVNTFPIANLTTNAALEWETQWAVPDIMNQNDHATDGAERATYQCVPPNYIFNPPHDIDTYKIGDQTDDFSVLHPYYSEVDEPDRAPHRQDFDRTDLFSKQRWDFRSSSKDVSRAKPKRVRRRGASRTRQLPRALKTQRYVIQGHPREGPFQGRRVHTARSVPDTH